MTNSQFITAVTYTHDADANKAEQLALELNLPFITDVNSNEAQRFTFLLALTPTFLGLQRVCEKKWAPFYVDFASPTLAYRSYQASKKNELLVRAMGYKSVQNPMIVDATAGWGRDSFILASAGFNVIMLERSPVVFALLRDAMLRGAKQEWLLPILSRLTFIQAEATTWLTQQSLKPQVVYMDPMFPERQKSASVKKEMVILQDLLPTSEDDQTLFTTALACVTSRVVVKRPRLAANIVEIPPNYALSGKSSRFDIYLPLALRK